MPNRRNTDSAAWLHFWELAFAVIALSFLPYLSREAARSLGLWVIIAPGAALALAVFGGRLIYLEGQPPLTSRPVRANRRAEAALLLTLVAGAALNIGAVAAVWTKREARPHTSAESIASDLNKVAALPGVVQFAGSAITRPLPSTPRLKVMAPYIRGMLSRTMCTARGDRAVLGLPVTFLCTMVPTVASHWPQCRFTWTLSPVYARGALATVTSRDDVVNKFSHSGYGKFGLAGGRQGTSPYVGVAFVGCSRKPGTVTKANLHVAFVLSTESQIAKYGSALRTVGFDWIEPDHLAAPYIAELFSLASLYKVTRLISSDESKFPQTVTTSAHDDLFDKDAIEALRSIPPEGIRVGNRSDGQLGNSRGSCLLVDMVSGLTTDPARLHVAPSAVTSDLSLADRSLVLFSRKAKPTSLPCTLVSALVTRNMGRARNYPPALTGTRLYYRIAPGQSKQDAQRAAYNIRAAGLTLYLLGFDVTYDSKALRVVGSWPRSEFISTKTP
jgi:hypothetical protein